MGYDGLFDRAMAYVPPEWQFPLVLALFILAAVTGAICAVLYVRPRRPVAYDALPDIMRVIGDQATTASAIQRDLSGVRERTRAVEAENDGLREQNVALGVTITKLEGDVAQLLEHCRRLLRIVREIDRRREHEDEIRETEMRIDLIARH